MTSSKSIIDVMVKLLGVLECPVCFDYVKPPVQQCVEGHIICVTCKNKLRHCPVCEKPFGAIRIRALDDIAELMLYPCNNEGCDALLNLKDRKSHEDRCSYPRSNQDSKKSTLQNNLLKNIEETFAGFFSQKDSAGITVSAKRVSTSPTNKLMSKREERSGAKIDLPKKCMNKRTTGHTASSQAAAHNILMSKIEERSGAKINLAKKCINTRTTGHTASSQAAAHNKLISKKEKRSGAKINSTLHLPKKCMNQRTTGHTASSQAAAHSYDECYDEDDPYGLLQEAWTVGDVDAYDSRGEEWYEGDVGYDDDDPYGYVDAYDSRGEEWLEGDVGVYNDESIFF